METYHYVNIFETKGLEYLLLICFLVLFVGMLGQAVAMRERHNLALLTVSPRSGSLVSGNRNHV